MMRKLLEALTKFAGEPEQKPGEQWKGTDKGTPGKKLVGDSIIKDLSKGVTPKTKEEELAEAFANFNEDDLGVEEKRPHRTGTRADKVGVRGHKEQPRYKTVKDIDEDSLDNEYEGGESDNDYFDRQKPKKLSKRSQQRDNAADARKIGSFSVDGKVVRSNVNGLDHEQVAKELSNKYPGKNIEWRMTSKPFNEGWMNGSDRVNLPDGPMTYWNGTGRLQNEYNELYEKLVPSQGAAETIEGEVLRASSKIVYRHFNDGDLFNQASFDQLKQYIGTVTDYDDLAEKAIEFALKAQGNYHPNTGWDSLDAMDYGPTDDNDGWDEEDEYDDEDDTNWDEEDELEESSNVVARYADDRARGTGFVYNVDATGQITSSGNIRHNKKFSTPEKAMAYLDKCGFTKKGELEEGMEEFAKSQAKKRAEKRKSIPWPKEVPSDAEQERNRTRDEEENDPHPYADTPDLDEAKWRENPDAYSSELDDEGNEYKKSKGDVGRDLLKKDKLGYTRPGNANVVSKGARTGKATQSHINQLKGNIKHSLANHGKANLPEGEHDAEFIDHEDNWYNMADWARAEFKKGKSVEEVIKYLRDNDYLGPRDINNFMKTVSGEKWNESVEEGKHFRTAYGWAGGRNEKTGKMYKHPDQIKADREANKMAIAQAQIDADRENERDRFSQEELYPSDDSHDLDESTGPEIFTDFNTWKKAAISIMRGKASIAKQYTHPPSSNNPQIIAVDLQDGTVTGVWDDNEGTGTIGQTYVFVKGGHYKTKAPTEPNTYANEGWEADLARSNRERMKKERAAAKPMKPIAKAKPDYSRVFQDINSAIGDTFPDGDPMDALMRKYRDSYGDLNIDLLNKACRVNGAKSYHDYVAKVWQQHMQDNPDLVQGGNPWVAEGKSSESISKYAKELVAKMGHEEALEHALMMANMSRDTKWFPVIRYIRANKQGVAENDHPQHYVDRYNKDLERKIDKDFDPDYDRSMSDQEFEAKLKQRGKERNKGVELDEGITDFISKAKDKFLRLKDALSDEWAQSKEMWEIVRKGNRANPKEINFANKQFKDILRTAGLAAWYSLPIPGNTLLILSTEKILNQYGISIMPDKIKNQVLTVSEGQEDDGIYIGAKVYHRSHQTAEPFEVIQIIDDQRVRVIDDVGNKAVVLISELVPATVSEGWGGMPGAPDEITKQERDPDAEYDARRQEKLDAEADSAPKTTTYQCVGRGPNNEPNYKFGPEHNTSEEAVAYRKKLMANPKTPNPRDIGIRTISKVAKGINEDVTSTDPLEGALLDAIHELIGQGHTDVDPMVLTNMVVAATSQPFLLKDLVDANNNSQAVQHYIDSISPSKVKFSSDMLTVKNEDPAKDKAKAQAGVSSMASRAANRSRLGESTEISKQGFPDAFISLVYRDAELNHDEQPVPMTKKPTKNDLASNVIVVKGKDGNFYGARAGKNEGYTVYGQVDGKVGKQYVSSIKEVASWIKSGEYFAIPLNSTYYKSREAQRYARGQDRQSSEYSAILTQMNNTFTPAIKQRIAEYIDYIYANLRKLSNEPGRYTFNNSSDQTNALQIVASLEQLVKAGFTRNTVDEYLRSLGKRDVGFGSHYTNIDRFLEQMKEPLAQAKFAKTILDQAKGLYNKVKDMLYAPTVNALTAEGVIDSSSNTTVVNNSSGSLYMASAAYMKQQAAKYQKHVAGTDSTPAGPDTSKFSATRSGMIAFEKDVTVHGGQYGFDRFYQNFVKIGGNVDYDIKKKMEAEFRAWLATTTGEANSAYVTPDRYYITIGDANGTNWGGYGLSFKKIDDNEWNKKYASLFNQSAEGVNEDIAISGRSTPLVDKNDLIAKRKELQKLQMSPWAHKDPKVRTEIIRRKAELMKQAEALGIDESTAHKLLKNKFQQVALQRKLGTPESDAAYKQHVERMKKSGADYVNNNPNTIYKKVDEFAAPGMAGPAATVKPGVAPVVDPAVAAKAAVATSTLKTATGTTVAPATLDKALDSATLGTATSTDVKALAPIMGVVNKAAQDPKLAAQFKNLAAQAKTTP